MIGPLLTALLHTATPARAELPPLETREQHGVYVDAPSGWKLLVKKGIRNVTLSSGLATNITLYWYDYKAAVTPDVMLGILLKTLREQLPVGEVTELNREILPGTAPHDLIRGERMNAEVAVGALGFGITMKLGFVTMVDQPNGRILAAVLLAPPEDYGRLQGVDLLSEVVRTFHLSEDAPEPTPAWWWWADTPPLLSVSEEVPVQ